MSKKRPARKGKKKMLIVLAAVFAVLAVWAVWGNTAIELNTYTITASRLPKSFEGYRIAHVSDLHNAQMGKNNEKLLAMLRDAAPDIIVITGDLIDSRNTKVDIALRFVEDAMRIAPCYYVPGNHEARVAEYGKLKVGMADAGVVILEDTSGEVRAAGETITLIGVSDPSFQTDYLFGDAESVMRKKLTELHADGDTFTVLLSHRPELFEVYVEYGIDLAFTGHAHGGQFRLPFIGGVIAPNQGFFPRFDAGIYTSGNTHMLVSRGIGNSLFPFRINNRPEVILVELKKPTHD